MIPIGPDHYSVWTRYLCNVICVRSTQTLDYTWNTKDSTNTKKMNHASWIVLILQNKTFGHDHLDIGHCSDIGILFGCRKNNTD